MFCNKGMKQINLNSSLESKDSITCFWGKIQLQENIPVTTYRPTIRNKNLNYKETVQSIIADGKTSFSSAAKTMHFERSTFHDKNHGHIITGDLILITNTKLSSILS